MLKKSSLQFAALAGSLILLSGCSAGRDNILMTGYWPPTNVMLKQFSPNRDINPDGWKGRNWRGQGYDVYAYFPVFPNGLRNNPTGEGDFQVDYQATAADFNRIAEKLRPVAIVSFGRGQGPWEIEYSCVNWRDWIEDYQQPYLPDLRPPDPLSMPGRKRHSTLPVQDIADAVNSADIGVHAWVDWDDDAGNFLGDYIGYMGIWYQQQHKEAGNSSPCYATGVIHVAGDLPAEQATRAAEITLEKTIEYVESRMAQQKGR